nr:hypothetical protein [Candidatus Baldrarchaeota archaeon]
MTPEQIAFLIIEILLVMGVLYISALAITGRKRVSTSYLASLFVVAVARAGYLFTAYNSSNSQHVLPG